MKKILLLLLSFSSVFATFAKKTDGALEVLQRVSRQTSIPVNLELKKNAGNMYY